MEPLTAGQVVLLNDMVRGASWYHPLRNPDRARQRRNRVLAMFHETGLVDRAEMERRQAAGLGLRPDLSSGASQYGAFRDLVGRQLRAGYRDRDLRASGLRIFTTLSPSVQLRAENALARGLTEAEAEAGALQGAVVVVEPDSAEVLALAGDRQRGRRAFNRAIDARRQVGSVIKPLVYLLALDKPERFSLLTPVEDEPVTLEVPGFGAWQPVNHDRVSHGTVPLLAALEKSHNQASVRVGLDVGVDALFALMNQLGVDAGRARHPAALLGAVREVVGAEGRTRARYPTRLRSLPQREALALVDFALRRVVTHGTARSLAGLLESDSGVRGKTGTTNDQRDAWFAGYSEDYLGVVWAGRDDNRPAGVGGASSALPVWAHLFNGLPTRAPRLAEPGSIEWFWVDWPSPLLADETCANALAVPFVAGSQPADVSDCVRR